MLLKIDIEKYYDVLDWNAILDTLINMIFPDRASRALAKNWKLFLDIYRNLTGQRTNLTKSTIHLPNWCNRRITSAIKSILAMNLGSFPFKYLGALISPRRLLVHQCHYLVNRVVSCINSWNHSKISKAGRAVLINSSLLSIPSYILSCYFVLDSTLDDISKLARKFLWNKGNTTLAKTKGGLGIMNLKNVKVALMAKNVFVVLNFENKHWIHILKLK